MKRTGPGLLIQSCLCLLLTPIVANSSNYYPSYSYPVYQPPQVYNYNTTVYQPYAVPLFTATYVPPTAVISGSVAYQQAITTTATAGAATAIQSTVQGVLGAEQQQVQQMSLEQRFDRLLAVMERQAGLSSPQQQQVSPHVQVFRQSCASCHTGQSAKGDFQLFDQAGVYIQPQQEAVGSIMYRISTSDPKLRMPPNGALAYEDHRKLIEGLLTQQPQKAEQPAPKQLPPEAGPKKTGDPF